MERTLVLQTSLSRKTLAAAKAVTSLVRDAGRALDRAIRRIEDRHRGELPYMRVARIERETRRVSAQAALTDAVHSGQDAAVAGLRALKTVHERAGTADILTRAETLQSLAGDAARLTESYLSVQDEVRGGSNDPAITDRTEPVWAGGLGPRMTAFAKAADQAASDVAASTIPTRSSMISVI